MGILESDQPTQLDGASSTGQLEVSEEPETVKDTKYVKVRRVNIVKDVLEIFIEPEVAKKALRIEFINENAIDDDGVSRELYTAFWEDFLTQCEGEASVVSELTNDLKLSHERENEKAEGVKPPHTDEKFL
ncbi:hypothetical protein E1301_Tti020935 [Triplophysa tibetana]|uniref:HECT domain-containing protein n=1 Tax=Triplophysa tibetana TaxID=1572043 RepID=A0A5A9MXN6_9TELE|nr:hypothetical protein E1301_Tti020935 [Triplophysa tibetana]